MSTRRQRKRLFKPQTEEKERPKETVAKKKKTDKKK